MSTNHLLTFWWHSHSVSYLLLFFPPQVATFFLPICKWGVLLQQRENHQQSSVTAATTKGCRSGQAAAHSACNASARESYSKHLKPQTRTHEWCRLTSGEPPTHTTSRHTRALLLCLRKSPQKVRVLLFFRIFAVSYTVLHIANICIQIQYFIWMLWYKQQRNGTVTHLRGESGHKH